MKEYAYEVEQSWEKQHRRPPPPPPPPPVDHQQRQRQAHSRHPVDDAAVDADASSMSGTYDKHLYAVASLAVYLKLKTK